MRFSASSRGFFKLLRRSICLTVISCRHWEVVPSKVGKFLAALVALFRTSSQTHDVNLEYDVNVVRKHKFLTSSKGEEDLRFLEIFLIFSSLISNLGLIKSFILVIKYLTLHFVRQIIVLERVNFRHKILLLIVIVN